MGLSVYSGTSRLPLLLCYYEKTTVNKIAKTAEKETLFILSELSAAILAHLLYQVLPKLSYCEYCITHHIKCHHLKMILAASCNKWLVYVATILK